MLSGCSETRLFIFLKKVRKQIFANITRRAELTRGGDKQLPSAGIGGGKMSQAISMLCSSRVTRWGSDSPSSSSITAHFIRAFRISDGIRVLSFPPSSVSELSKTTASSLSLHAVYMLPNGPMLTCKQPLYGCDMQRSFPAFATKATNGQSGNYRKLAKPRDKKNHENMSAKSDEQSDVEDNYEYPKQDSVSEFPADSYDHNIKPSSTAASSASEIVALFMKAKSQPKDDCHAKVKDQGFKMSETKSTRTVGSTFLEVLKKYLPQGEVQKNKALHFEAPRRQKTLTTQSLKSNSLPKALHTQSVEISPSSIKESLVVRKQDQRVSASCQPGGRRLVNDYVNLKQANKVQSESNFQSTTPHMLDTSRVTSMNTSESMPDQLASPLIEHMNLSTLRIPEMRIIAKSRGLKGYSKLKKGKNHMTFFHPEAHPLLHPSLHLVLHLTLRLTLHLALKPWASWRLLYQRPVMGKSTT